MPKYAILDFDPTDSAEQFAIVYNDYIDGGGDCHIDWFDNEHMRASQVEKDINNGIIYLTKWEKQNA